MFPKEDLRHPMMKEYLSSTYRLYVLPSIS